MQLAAPTVGELGRRHKNIPSPPTLHDAVLLTMAYFDTQGLPLTAFEAWRNLLMWRASYKQVQEELTLLTAKGQCEHHDGYYTMRGPEHVATRQRKLKDSEFKWRRARWVAGLLSLIPFIEAVAVVDSVALGKAKAGSDIDFFVVTRPGRMWTARMLATGLTQLLRLRRHGKRVRDRACLSFYATSDALGLEPLAITGGDLYLAQWVFLVSTVWEQGAHRSGSGTPDLARRLRAANPWAQELFLQAEPPQLTNRRRVGPVVAGITRPVQAVGELVLAGRLGRWVEAKLRAVQLSYMRKPAPYELKTRSSHIVINDRMLKFHEQDRRTWFREQTVATYYRLRAGSPLGLESPSVRFFGGLMVQPVGATVSASVTTSSA